MESGGYINFQKLTSAAIKTVLEPHVCKLRCRNKQRIRAGSAEVNAGLSTKRLEVRVTLFALMLASIETNVEFRFQWETHFNFLTNCYQILGFDY